MLETLHGRGCDGCCCRPAPLIPCTLESVRASFIVCLLHPSIAPILQGCRDSQVRRRSASLVGLQSRFASRLLCPAHFDTGGVRRKYEPRAGLNQRAFLLMPPLFHGARQPDFLWRHEGDSPAHVHPNIFEADRQSHSTPIADSATTCSP